AWFPNQSRYGAGVYVLHPVNLLDDADIANRIPRRSRGGIQQRGIRDITPNPCRGGEVWVWRYSEKVYVLPKNRQLRPVCVSEDLLEVERGPNRVFHIFSKLFGQHSPTPKAGTGLPAFFTSLFDFRDARCFLGGVEQSHRQGFAVGCGHG